jgi:uncharacterized protein (DUF362 family)
MNTDVAVRIHAGAAYPTVPPFDPTTDHPDAPFGFRAEGPCNAVYDLVRSALVDLRLDGENLGSADWSPLRGIACPGQTVLIKPNLVKDVSRQDAVTTHASVVRPLVDYCWKAMQGRGRIIIADAPQAETDFDTVVDRNGLRAMVGILRQRGVQVGLEDLRALRVILRNGVWVGEQEVPARRAESAVVDLGPASMFSTQGCNAELLYGGGYGRKATVAHHSGGRHEYCVSRSVLAADLVISVPKLKTHKKAGVTCCLKNLVGINVDKNYLPHFSIGPENQGGDEFPGLSRWRSALVAATRQVHDLLLDRHWRTTGKWVSAILGAAGVVLKPKSKDSCGGNDADVAGATYRLLSGVNCRQGAWQGNETIWKMILDLNRLFFFARSDGTVADSVQRRMFFLVDGIICGEGDGPMNPTAVSAGIVAAGQNPFLVDFALLRLAGIDPTKVPLYREALRTENAWLNTGREPSVSLNGAPVHPLAKNAVLHLRPPANWDFS